jgi:endonuclease/exonuclease/phosphatase family metal-dependent hydrolase
MQHSLLSRFKYSVFKSFAIVTIATLAITTSTASAKPSNDRHNLLVQHYPEATQPNTKDDINLVTLNLAHGRKVNLSQILTSEKQIKKNLTNISEFFVAVDGDVVALQEADLPSWWSGNFDHITHIAKRSDYGHSAHTAHVDNWFGKYGTAILSKHPISYAEGVTFSPSFPTTRKGFTLIEVEWQTTQGLVKLDVVSLHMDFLRESVRKQQLAELTEVLIVRDNPLAIMGDFNSADIAERLVASEIEHNLHTYQASNSALSTYKNKRLDWIILSNDLQFNQFFVSPLVMSDHRAIVANISLVKQ